MKMNEISHITKRLFGGKEETSWIQVKCCNCGQISRKVYAYEDYQRTIIRELENDHKYKGNKL